jgi:hypothetical protein
VSGKRRRRPAGPRPAPVAVEPTEPAMDSAEAPAEPRRGFGGALFGRGDASVMPPVGRSLGRGLLAVVSSPVLLAIAVLVPLLAWLALYSLGFEGRPALLVDVLALPPIATYFDLGTGESLLGLGPSFLIFTGVAILIRGVLYGLLAGMIVESLEDGRVSSWGLLRGVAAIPTVIVVQVLSFMLILASNIIFPVLGPGIGLLAAVGSLVGGLFFLGFAPTAAVRQRRGVVETIRRSGRAAMLPGSRHLLFCGLYFFIALPVAVGLAPGGGEVTANPSFFGWVFVLAASVLHLGFMGGLAYRWIVAEPSVPEQPLQRRRASQRQPSRRPSGRR